MAKILLVEDDKSLREIYSVRLIAEGYEIVSAGDGEEALAMAIKERPDLIVSDVMMPKISGFDMLDILRSTTETKDVKVIMMTALSSEDQRARGEALGADRYLVKSQVGIEDVVRTVHDVLGDSIVVATSPVFAPVAAPFAPAPFPVAPPVVSAPFEAPSAVPVAQATPTYAEPAPAPVYNAPVPNPAPLVSPAYEPLPIAPVVEQYPGLTPAPAAPEAFAASPAPSPFAQPFTAPAPAPVITPNPMPQPIAPFSSPAPASLGERVIAPLTDFSAPTASSLDLSSQIEQALNGTSVLPTPPTV
jgi:CheY-like chemotaxis protein